VTGKIKDARGVITDPEGAIRDDEWNRLSLTCFISVYRLPLIKSGLFKAKGNRHRHTNIT